MEMFELNIYKKKHEYLTLYVLFHITIHTIATLYIQLTHYLRIIMQKKCQPYTATFYKYTYKL